MVKIKSYNERLNKYYELKNKLDSIFKLNNNTYEPNFCYLSRIDYCSLNKRYYELKAILEETHDSLEYGKVDLINIIDFYKSEYKSTLISLLTRKGVEIDNNIINYFNVIYNEQLSIMLKEIDLCLKVWFLRELYYVFRNLAIGTESKDIAFDFIKLMYTNQKETLYKMYDGETIKNAEEEWIPTSINMYFDNIYYYNKSLSFNNSSRFNYLLNIAHNNGNMATKFIVTTGYHEYEISELLNRKGWYDARINREVRVLSSLSNGEFIPLVNNEMKRVLRLPLNQILNIA